jgi:hypothetical protein
MDELIDDIRDEEAGRGLYSTDGAFEIDRDLLDSLRRMRDAKLLALRRKILLGMGPQSLDRPGAASPLTEAVWRLHPSTRSWETEEILGPGRFILPEPPTRSGDPPWRLVVRQIMASHQSGWRTIDVLTGYPLALDIAVRGERRDLRDLDNLARDVVGPFEEIFCAGARGAVASYRVYVSDFGQPGVRVSVIADGRLALFEAAVETTRRWVLTRGPRFSDTE